MRWMVTPLAIETANASIANPSAIRLIDKKFMPAKIRGLVLPGHVKTCGIIICAVVCLTF